ncbi:MAG: DUF3048 domain-containing protein [Chloroflexi bacterium]|nr:DUF3048 domain-containing protein [Chloroflexota bacterium]
MKKRISQTTLTIFFLASIVLSACQSTNPQEMQQTLQVALTQTLAAAPTATATPVPTATITPLPTATATPVEVKYGPSNFPENVNPLTGLVVSDTTLLDRRPVMVKVANFPPEGRPHAGLSSADIVFDYYIGNGANRFLALFYGTDAKKVGPVRSGRLVDRWLVRMYGGILGMEYAYPEVFDQIMMKLGTRLLYSDHCPALCSDGPLTEISRFANTLEMSKLYSTHTNATNFKQNLDGMVFDSIPSKGGVNATEFTMHYGKNNDAQWKYDSASGKYLRWINELNGSGEAPMIPLIDRTTGKQLEFSNIVVLFAEIETLNGDDSLHEINIAGVSHGRAIIVRDGKMYDVFYKSAYDTPIQFFDKDKNPVALQPGNTWIHLTGVYSKVNEDPSGIWKVSLGKP